MNINIEETIKKAKELGSYLLTLTTKDKTKAEGDLTHYCFRNDFPTDDIIPSIDHSLRLLNIRPPLPVSVIIPPKIREKKSPLKIAIITHFSRCPDSYSPGRATKNLIKMLLKYGHIPVFFTQEGSKLTQELIGCEVRPVVTRFHREKNIVNEEAKNKFIEVLKRELTPDFNLVITMDLYIDDCITYREAIKESNINIKWLHWARSGVGHPINFKMSNAKYIYMNYADVGHFAKNIGVQPEDVRVVFNEKDPSLLSAWHPVTKMISDKMRLWEKQIIQIYPICTTRMDAKGLNSIIRVFGELKKLGNDVALIVCNSNGRRRIDEIKNKIKFAEECGLINEQDFIFTSTLSNPEYQIETEVPHKVVIDLMQISNLFVIATIAEVCSNILLEASMTKNLIVYNSDLPCLADFVNKNSVLNYPFTSLKSIHYNGLENSNLKKLAKDIIIKLRENYADRQFRKVWKTHCLDSIYYEMLEPILYE